MIAGSGGDTTHKGDYTATDKMWYIKPMHAFVVDASQNGLAQTLRCSQAKPGDRCLNILFSWSPYFTWQKGFLMSIVKQQIPIHFGLVVTTAGNFYERKEKDPLPEHWTRYLAWWAAHVGAGHLAVTAWSYTGGGGFIHDGGVCENTRLCSADDPRPAAIDTWCAPSLLLLLVARLVTLSPPRPTSSSSSSSRPLFGSGHILPYLFAWSTWPTERLLGR